MPDRPTYRPVYKALHRPLTIWGVDRRLFFLALLLGAATFNLFYSFLAGLLMFGGLYGFALWATARDPEMLRILLASSRRAGATTRASTTAWTWRWRHGERRPHPPRLPRRRQRERPARALGLRRRHDVPDEGRPRRRRVPASRRGLRGPVAPAAPGARAPVRGGAAAAGRALPRLPVPAQADGRTVRRRRRASSRSPTRRSSAARPT